MKKKQKKIYRSRTPVKTFFKFFFIILAILIILAIVIFFAFQRYIVYTDSGVRLEIPFFSFLYE